LARLNKWQHWQKIYALILFIILGGVITRTYERYKKYQQNQHKIDQLKKQKEEKLALIHEEEEEKLYQKIKREIIEDASKNTEAFTLKLEKWLEMLQNSQAFEENPKEAYEKLAVVILFVDFECPGLSTKIIKSLHSEHVKDTIHSIENISKVGTDKTRNNLIEFNENFMTNETLFGGKTTSNHIIDSAFDEKEKRRLFNIDSEAPFGFIDHVKPSKLKEFLMNENEVVAAFILNKCSEARMLEITAMLPSEKLKSIAKHLVNVKNNPCETMDKFEEQMKDILFIGETSEASKNKIQIQKASSVFETLPKDVRASIFSELESNDPETLSQIQAEMFMFEDIERLTDVDMQRLIFEIKDMQLLATALNQSSTDLVNRFKSNFSERFETQFDTARETLVGIQDEAIEKAQYEIIRTLRFLERNEQISNLKQLKRSSE
jgi:flagellar motor switch protein FliG